MTVNLNASEARRRRVWDVPVRVTHALLITCVAGAWLTREATRWDLHAVFGYCALALVAFRIAWGFAAGGHARFSSFAYGPRTVFAYLGAALRGEPRHYTGHNPAGSWSVFGLLALLAAVSVTGVLVIGGAHASGPLPGAVSFAAADLLRDWHEALAWAVLLLALLHVAGVAWGSRVHRENLVGAMVTGRKVVHESSMAEARPNTGLGLLLAGAATTFALGYLGWIAPHDVERRTQAEASRKAALSATAWGKDCGECHLAYAPAMLPLRSWERTLAEHATHFGEDLGLSDSARRRLLDEARAAPVPSWASWKLAKSVPAGDAPLEVSVTPFWREAHEALPESDFKPPASAGRHDCEACHSDAASGIFHPRMIHIPKGRVAP